MDDPTMRREPTEGYTCPTCKGFHYHWQPLCEPPKPVIKMTWCGECHTPTQHEVTAKNGSRFETCKSCGVTYELYGLNGVRRIA